MPGCLCRAAGISALLWLGHLAGFRVWGRKTKMLTAIGYPGPVQQQASWQQLMMQQHHGLSSLGAANTCSPLDAFSDASSSCCLLVQPTICCVAVQLEHAQADRDLSTFADEQSTLAEARRQLALVHSRSTPAPISSQVPPGQPLAYKQQSAGSCLHCLAHLAVALPPPSWVQQAAALLQTELLVEDECIVCREKPATVGLSHHNRCGAQALLCLSLQALQHRLLLHNSGTAGGCAQAACRLLYARQIPMQTSLC